MDVILTISFKIAEEIEIREHVLRPNSQTKKFGFLLHNICSFIAMKCVYIVFLLSTARLIRLHKLYKAFAGGGSMAKELN